MLIQKEIHGKKRLMSLKLVKIHYAVTEKYIRSKYAFHTFVSTAEQS